MATPMAGNKNYNFGTDVLVDILVRLPPSSRRRARLVCRHWRNTVDKRTTEMQRRHVTTLISAAVEKNTGMGKTSASGYVVDNISGWSGVKVWTSDDDVHVIGASNGLICLCDDRKPGGGVSLINSTTDEQLVVPPLPRYHSSGQGPRVADVPPLPRHRPPGQVRRWHKAYSFGYHPVAGRYKIVHVPLSGWGRRRGGKYTIAVQVFTLGETSWRNVRLPAAVRVIGILGSGGLVSVDGTTCWLAKDAGAGKVVSFDLGDERICASPLPVAMKPGVALTVVHGRLGVAVDRNGKTDVWVLDGKRWSRRYEVQLDGLQRLTSPHFAHGKYVLTAKEPTDRWRQGSVLYGHSLTEKSSLLMCDVSRSRDPAVRGVEGSIHRAFAYVATTEPLSIYQPAYPKTTSCSLLLPPSRPNWRRFVKI